MSRTNLLLEVTGRSEGNFIVEGDGVYPSEAGVECTEAGAILVVPERHGAVVALGYSRDGGTTWESVTLGRTERSRTLNVHAMRIAAPVLLRMRVTGFVRPFAVWWEGRT